MLFIRFFTTPLSIQIPFLKYFYEEYSKGVKAIKICFIFWWNVQPSLDNIYSLMEKGEYAPINNKEIFRWRWNKGEFHNKRHISRHISQLWFCKLSLIQYSNAKFYFGLSNEFHISALDKIQSSKIMRKRVQERACFVSIDARI